MYSHNDEDMESNRKNSKKLETMKNTPKRYTDLKAG